MKKSLIFISILLLSCNLFLEAGLLQELFPRTALLAASKNQKETVTNLDFRFDGEWAGLTKAERDGIIVVEWLPCGANSAQKKEVISIQYMPRSAIQFPAKNLQDLMNEYYAGNKNLYPDLVWETLSQSENEITFDMRFVPTERWKFEHRISKVIWTDQAVHFLQYHKIGSEIDGDTRERWLQSLKNVKVETIK